MALAICTRHPYIQIFKVCVCPFDMVNTSKYMVAAPSDGSRRLLLQPVTGLLSATVRRGERDRSLWRPRTQSKREVNHAVL